MSDSACYGRGKRDNDYARALSEFAAPKTVFMAVAFSLALRLQGSDDTLTAKQLVFDEWVKLHKKRLVSQKPRML